jgi:hypothetical protein
VADAQQPPVKRRGLFKKILIAFGVILLLFLAIVALQPGEFRITRSTVIAAPTDVVFAQVNDFHRWNDWSPWAKLDPAAKNSFEGPAAGTGAKLSWAGNDKIGEGQMTILESRPGELIQIKLEFFKPFPGVSTSEFTFKPEGGKTTVVWSMYGKHSFMEKAVCLFMNMDKMIGGDFETGLASIKTIAEAEGAATK